MRSKILTVLAVLMSVFVLTYAGYQAWRFLYNPYQTEIAVKYSIEESLHVNGIAVRTETIIDSNFTESVSYVYEDAARVLKNKTIAYTHTQDDTMSKMERVEELEREINLLKNANAGTSQIYGSLDYINLQIGSSLVDYADKITSGSLSDFSASRDNLLLTIDKKAAITGVENNFSDRIAVLEQERDLLSNEIDNDEADKVVSPKTGYFISKVDGFENVINKEMLLEMNASQVEELINREAVTVEEKIGKIADNYKWYYAISVEPENAEKFYEGRKVQISFDGILKPLEFTVDKVIQDETSDNTAVLLLCETFTSEVASLRQVSADIYFTTFSGLKISEGTIRFDENQEKGVFVLDRSKVVFKYIDVIYEGNGYYIVKNVKTDKTSLQLYDEVFVGGNDLYVGKIVN